MSKQSQILLGLALVAIVAGVVIWQGSARPQSTTVQPFGSAQGKPLKVGAILSLTGSLDFVGKGMQQGMELARADYPNTLVEVSYEDDKSLDRTAAVGAVSKLINVDRAALIFNTAVNETNVMAPILNREHVPGVTLWDSDQLIANAGEYVFTVGYGTELNGERMAEFAYRQLGLRHIAVVSAKEEWSTIISDAFTKRFSALGGTIDLHEKINLEETDLRGIILKVKQAKSEALYFPTFLQSLPSIIRQSRELGFRGKLLTGDTVSADDLKNLGKYTEGVYMTQIWLDNPEIKAKYEKKYGPTDGINLAFVGLGYDAIKLAAEVAQKLQAAGQPITPQAVQQALIGYRLNGLTGQVTLAPGKLTTKRESILVVKNGQFTLVEK